MKTNIKKILIASLPLFAILVSGCFNKSSGKKHASSVDPTSEAPTTQPTSYVPSDSSSISMPSYSGDPDDPNAAKKYITGITLKYTKDFYMQVAEELDFSVTFKGGGDDSQKGIQWQSSNPYVVKIDVKEKTSQCVLTALREGSATIIARSTYNRSFTDSVTITVIDNSYYTYFWQMDKSGPNKDDNKKFNGGDGATLKEGTANLNGMDWNFKFDTPDKAVGGGQSLTFGSTAQPYGNVTFSTQNSRYIRKISVLCSSSAIHIDDGSAYGTSGDEGSSKITISVGDTKYVDNIATPKYSNDQPLDTVTGLEFNDKSLTGDITIHFSPTYKDAVTQENSGAIYLKSIIIEYYRGDLVSIAVDEENSVNQTNFFVGSKFSTDGIIINAKYSESSEIDVVVTHKSTFTTANLDENGNFTSEATNQVVNVSFEGKSTSFKINIYGKLKSIVISGTMSNKLYLVYDPMDYTGMSVNLMVEGKDTPALTYSLNDYATKEFERDFDTTNIHKVAVKSLQNGFTIDVKHRLTNLNGTYSFAKDDVVVKQVANINIQYKDGTSPYSETLVDGEAFDFSEWNAVVTYDNEETETFPFEQLSKQTYVDPKNSKKKLPRYNYMSYSPLVCEKTLETLGFSIGVTCLITNKGYKIDIPANQVTVLTYKALTFENTGLAVTEYDEYDEMDYTGINLKVTYSDESSLTYAYEDAVNATCAKAVLEKGEYKVEAAPLFEFTSPTEASLAMMNEGFTIGVKHTRSDLTAELQIPKNSINVKVYVPKTYTRVESFADFDAEGYYIITSIDADNSSILRVWNGALDKEHVWDTPAKGGNYITYNHTGVIGSSLTIPMSKVEKAVFKIVKNESTVTVILASSEGLAKPLKLTINSGDASFAATTTSNAAKQNLLTNFDGNGNVQLGFNSVGIIEGQSYQKFIYYNKAANADRFGSYKPGTNTVPIQIYKIGA